MCSGNHRNEEANLNIVEALDFYVTRETNGVHREGVADHLTRPRAAKPQHDRRNFLRATRASDGYAAYACSSLLTTSRAKSQGSSRPVENPTHPHEHIIHKSPASQPPPAHRWSAVYLGKLTFH
jgi:hypothetical protein